MVARDLLGRDLVCIRSDGTVLVARISETEAYHEQERACHAFAGRRTARTEPMFAQGGVLYVYFVYGMHWACNVVTGARDVGEAVLLRGAVPILGAQTMAMLRGYGPGRPAPQDERRWMDGPGKLAQGLGLTGVLSGQALGQSASVWIAAGHEVGDAQVVTGPRVGVAYAGDDANLPWRFRIVEQRVPPNYPNYQR